jgi:hypothetical protein
MVLVVASEVAFAGSEDAAIFNVGVVASTVPRPSIETDEPVVWSSSCIAEQEGSTFVEAEETRSEFDSPSTA